MYINMLNILENLPIFEWYFNYKNFILEIMSLVLSMILVASIFWQLDEQLDDNLWGLIDKDTCVKDAIIIGSILIIGMLLNAAGMELKLKLNHMPLVLFFYGSMLLFFIRKRTIARTWTNKRSFFHDLLFVFLISFGNFSDHGSKSSKNERSVSSICFGISVSKCSKYSYGFRSFALAVSAIL